MIPRRKIVREPRYLADLERSGVSLTDPRVEAAEWYICHSTRHRDARKVGTTSHGPLYAYRTRRIGKALPITVYFYERDGGSTVCLAGMMSPTVEE